MADDDEKRLQLAIYDYMKNKNQHKIAQLCVEAFGISLDRLNEDRDDYGSYLDYRPRKLQKITHEGEGSSATAGKTDVNDPPYNQDMLPLNDPRDPNPNVDAGVDNRNENVNVEAGVDDNDENANVEAGIDDNDENVNVEAGVDENVNVNAHEANLPLFDNNVLPQQPILIDNDENVNVEAGVGENVNVNVNAHEANLPLFDNNVLPQQPILIDNDENVNVEAGVDENVNMNAHEANLPLFDNNVLPQQPIWNHPPEPDVNDWFNLPLGQWIPNDNLLMDIPFNLPLAHNWDVDMPFWDDNLLPNDWNLPLEPIPPANDAEQEPDVISLGDVDGLFQSSSDDDEANIL